LINADNKKQRLNHMSKLTNVLSRATASVQDFFLLNISSQKRLEAHVRSLGVKVEKKRVFQEDYRPEGKRDRINPDRQLRDANHAKARDIQKSQEVEQELFEWNKTHEGEQHPTIVSAEVQPINYVLYGKYKTTTVHHKGYREYYHKIDTDNMSLGLADNSPDHVAGLSQEQNLTGISRAPDTAGPQHTDTDLLMIAAQRGEIQK
jgi:hypothetical protein